MKLFKIALAALVLLIALPELEAQRGGRGGSKRKSKSRTSQRGRASEPSPFSSKLWYGAGGTLGFSSNGQTSFSAVGLTPMVGYKFNEWLSAGPRVGVTWNTLKGTTDLNSVQRASIWDFEAGLFARGKILQFYIQTEFDYINRANIFSDLSGRIVTDDTGQILTERESNEQFLIGVGYNPGIGSGLGTDIGIFYNLFDDVTSIAQSPFVFRVMLTLNY